MQTLRPDQVATVDAIAEGFALGHRRILVQRPTGYGKTTVGAHLAANARAKGKTFHFYVHRNELVEQAEERLAGEVGVVGVVGDGREVNVDCGVVVVSIQTFAARRRRDAWTLPPANLTLIDECQHAAASTWSDAIEHTGKGLVVGVSATPWQPNGKPLPHFTYLVDGVAPFELVGPGLPLCDVRIFSGATPKLSTIPTKGIDFDDKALADAYRGLDADIVGTWWQHGRERRTICFASSTEHSKALVEQWRKLQITAEHIDHETPRAERKRIIAAFRDGAVQVLSNYGLITEGFDVPAAACVVLARATKSESLFVQMVGRGLRATADKDRLLLLDHGRNCLRFGHPLADRLASLTASRPKQKLTEEQLEDGVSAADGLRLCVKCLSLVPTSSKVCPECGAAMGTPRLPRVNKKNSLIEWMKRDFAVADTDAKRIAKKREHWKHLLADSFQKQKVGGIFRAVKMYHDAHGVRPHADPGVLDEAEKRTYTAMIAAAAKQSNGKRP